MTRHNKLAISRDCKSPNMRDEKSCVTTSCGRIRWVVFTNGNGCLTKAIALQKRPAVNFMRLLILNLIGTLLFLPYQISLASPHYVAQQAVGVNDLVITLDTTTFIEGVVTAVEGAPAAGVTVRAAQKNIQGDGVLISEVITETTTDELGNYRLYVFPDAYEITIASTVGVIRTENLHLDHGTALKNDMQLRPGVRFEAIVIDADSDQPFAGLVLWSFTQKQFIGTSDAQRRLVIDGMLPGNFDFSLGAGESIEFRGMTFHANGPLGRWWSAEATKEWERRKLDPGKFQRNFDGLEFDLQPGMEAVEIFVAQGVEFSGHVYDPAGKPRGGATVAPAKTGSGNSLTGDTRYSVKTEDDGSYKVVMPAGNDFEYNLMAFDGEYSQWRRWGAVAREPLPTKPGQKVGDYDFCAHARRDGSWQSHASRSQWSGTSPSPSTCRRPARQSLLRSDCGG